MTAWLEGQTGTHLDAMAGPALSGCDQSIWRYRGLGGRRVIFAESGMLIGRDRPCYSNGDCELKDRQVCSKAGYVILRADRPHSRE